MGPNLTLDARNACIPGSMSKSDHAFLGDGTPPQLLLSLHSQAPLAGLTGHLLSLSSSSLIHTHESALWSLSYNSSPAVCAG